MARVPHALRLAPVMALAALAITLSALPASAGSLAEPQEKIVETCTFDFVVNLCSMNPDGTGEVMLTNDGPTDLDPEVSPSGHEIAWTYGADRVWVMKSDGSHPHVLQDFGAPNYAPTWSPTGTKLAFGCWVQASPDEGICIANADGTGWQLAYNSYGATQPDWSPDGRYIAFESSVGQDHKDIYVLDLNSGQAMNVTNSAGQEEHGARWSPDGMRLAFAGQPLPNEPQNGGNIYVMDADGSNRTALFHPTFGPLFSSPAWSEDGSKIAFICDNTPSSAREMCIVDVKSNTLAHDIEMTPTHQSEGWTEPFWGSTGGTQQGDVDCNGSADTVDYLKILRYVAGLSVSHNTPCPEIGDDFGKSAPALWGDLDCNGAIDSVDALKGLRFVAGLPVVQNEPCWDLGSIVVPA